MAATVSLWRCAPNFPFYAALLKSHPSSTLNSSPSHLYSHKSLPTLRSFVSGHLATNQRRHIAHPAAITSEQILVTEEFNDEDTSTSEIEQGDFILFEKAKQKPCELYICNLPRSCDISEIADMLAPFGSILSVEVSKDPQTGISKGCAYAVMSSIEAARGAVRALDGSDVGGREMRVRYGADMRSRGEVVRSEAMNSSVTKTRIYEGAYQLYAGNLSWNVTPEELKEKFSKFGRVLSVRLMYDRREGKKRAYGFLSFDSERERDSALLADRTVFQGRSLVVRRGVKVTNQ